MDTGLLDALSRLLVATRERRTLLRLAMGAALGGLAGWPGLAEVEARNRKTRRRQRRRRRRREQCVPNAIPLQPAVGICSKHGDCCGMGRCCAFRREFGEQVSACYDLLSHTTACGHTCDTVVNCLNTGQQCVNGECVDI